MSEDKPRAVYRKDYRQPDYWIDSVDLHFELGDAETRVRARLKLRLNESIAGDRPPLVLQGEELTTEAVLVDGRELGEREYHISHDELTISNVPSRFELETLVRIRPQDNTSLSGLYRSGGLFCTQCEAMGFRRITWFLDRPDVMALFTTSIDADKSRYPVLLSNGNKLSEERSGWRREPAPRALGPIPSPQAPVTSSPSWLVICAATQRIFTTTFSGREVRLEIWVEPQNIDRCAARPSSRCRRRWRWDEEKLRSRVRPRRLHDRGRQRLQHGCHGEQGLERVQLEVRTRAAGDGHR